jgi:hypothetical protein
MSARKNKAIRDGVSHCSTSRSWKKKGKQLANKRSRREGKVRF